MSERLQVKRGIDRETVATFIDLINQSNAYRNEADSLERRASKQIGDVLYRHDIEDGRRRDIKDLIVPIDDIFDLIILTTQNTCVLHSDKGYEWPQLHEVMMRIFGDEHVAMQVFNVMLDKKIIASNEKFHIIFTR